VENLEQIIVQCQKGNRKAFKIIYEQFAPKLFAVCLRYCKNRTEAEDLLHEGFIKIFEKIGQFKEEGAFEAWMRRVMVNTVMDYLRNKQKIVFVDEREEFLNNYEDKDDDKSDDEIAEVDINKVNELINKLPEKYKLVFNLYVVENYSHEKIASALGISTGTSKSNLSRARKWLKQKLFEKGT